MADAELFLATASGENVKLWSMPNLELHSVRPFTGVVNCTCWSPNNSLLATAVEGNQINVASLKGDSNADISTNEEQLCLCFSTNSRYLLSGGSNGVAQIWDLKYKTSRKSFKDQKSSILCATFNYNDTTIASGAANGDVMLHSVANGSLTGLLKMRQTQAIRGIQFSNFIHHMLATASDDSAINLWDVNTKRIIKEFSLEHKLPASGLCFSPANDMLMCSIGVDKKIIFYDVVGKKTIKTITTDSPLTSADFYHTGSTIAVGSSTGKLYLFDLRGGSIPIKTTLADKTAMKTVTFQKLIPKSAPEGLTRRGSNSSIGSATSIKSREGPSDYKETRNATHQEEKEATSKENSKVVNATNQPASSLFSPIRGGESSAAGLKGKDTDIVPFETMRAELLKKSSILSGMYSDRPRVSDEHTTQSDAAPLRLPERSNLPSFDKPESHLKDETSKARPSLSKTSSDSRLSYQSSQTNGETSRVEVVTTDRETAKESPQNVATPDGRSISGFHQIQIDAIRNIIDDATEDMRESMHRSFVHLQAEMLRQFHLQQEEVRTMMEHLSPNQQLIEENARLKEEIKRLKTNF